MRKAFLSAIPSGSRGSTHRLADLLQHRFQTEQVALVGSGTQALTLAIQLAHAEGGGRVAIPAFACYDVATAAVAANVPIELYDIEPQTLGPDWASLERALANGSRIVVVAYLYGLPVDWDRVERLAGQYGAIVIEDAAQGIGGSWKGVPLGSLAPMGVLSFGRGKGWTGGGGGALLLRSGWERPATLSKPAPATSVILGGKLLAQWLLARPALYGVPYHVPWLHLGETRYKDPQPPRPMARLAAAHVAATADLAQSEAATRQRTAAALKAELDGTPGVSVPTPPDNGTAGYLRFPCLVHDPALRDQLLAELGPFGVAPSYPEPLPQLQVLRSRIKTRPTPGAEQLAGELITLPTHSRLAAADLDRLRILFRGRK